MGMHEDVEARHSDMKMAYLETGLRPSDLILDCFQGHIALMEFQGLQKVKDSQPAGFTHAFHTKVYELLQMDARSWETDELIKIKAGWASTHMLLIGFKYEASHEIAQSRLSSLARRFASLSRLVYPAETGNLTHEVFFGRVAPIFSMVTKPKLMSYQNLAAILINDLQQRKPSVTGAAGEGRSGLRSAMWLTSPTSSVNNPAATSQERQECYEDSTRRLLRRTFKNQTIRLEGTPAINPVTRRVDSINASLISLDTMIRGAGLIRETVEPLCASLGMTWELDTALLNQALHEANQARDGLTPKDMRIGVPIHAETVLSWSEFPEDLSDVLNLYPRKLTGALRIYLRHRTDNGVTPGRMEVSRINNWIHHMHRTQGIQVYSELDDLAIHGNFSSLSSLSVQGFRISGPIVEGPEAEERLKSIIRYRNKLNESMAIVLGTNAAPSIQRIAEQIGVNAIEHSLKSTDRGLNQAFAWTLNSGGRNSQNSGLIDARSRFLNTSESYLSNTCQHGVHK